MQSTHPLDALRRHVPLWAGALLLAFASAASAQIRIGHPAGFTGAAAAGVKENTDGARLVFDAVNAQGGINGQRIEMVSADDGFQPERTVALARQMIKDGAIALFMTRGTPHSLGLLPLLEESQIPLVAPSTGALALHKPVNPWVFNVRSSYQGETRRLVEHARLMGQERLAILQVDDSFGNDAVQGAITALSANNLSPVNWQKFKRDKPDFAALMPELTQSAPQVVLFIGTAGPVADGIRLLRSAGYLGPVMTMSNNASGGFVTDLGSLAHGIVMTQVFPSEHLSRNAFVREAKGLVATHPEMTLTQAMLEGMAAAKVLVEGLRQAGKVPTRSSLRQALEGIQHLNLGGLDVSYGAKDHSGINYIDIAIIDKNGRFMR
jgi:branched-chain amino acid transport system substrate-binding protein